MALSKSVEESLKEAESNLRNALSYAARQERPIVCKQISVMIADIDQLMKFDNMLDTLEKHLNDAQKD